jgi:hypothetical protein
MEGKQYIQARVGLEDYDFFIQKFAYGLTGKRDIVLAILFKKLIDELRRIDRESPLEPAFYRDHANYVVLEDALARLTFVERRAVGVDSVGGAAPTQYDTGGTDRVRAAVQPAPIVKSVKKGRAATRKRSSKGSKEKAK